MRSPARRNASFHHFYLRRPLVSFPFPHIQAVHLSLLFGHAERALPLCDDCQLPQFILRFCLVSLSVCVCSTSGRVGQGVHVPAGQQGLRGGLGLLRHTAHRYVTRPTICHVKME
jgi:hypothetical protein